MPELPEVETTKRGIEPYLLGRNIYAIEIREPRMRWPVEDDVLQMTGQRVNQVCRRAKYILMNCDLGTLILHLGMSGSLRICPHEQELRKHDHFIMRLDKDLEMRLHDPRRFGAVIWHDASKGPIDSHPLLCHLGPEPLSNHFNSDYLVSTCHQRKTSIKQHIMNNRVVVGVGNIYACEALFRSGIHPARKAGRIAKARINKLTNEIKLVLKEAIKQGGTTLRDFLREDGSPGYFKQQLNVYDREGKPCHACESKIKKIILGNRSTYYCPRCQR